MTVTGQLCRRVGLALLVALLAGAGCASPGRWWRAWSAWFGPDPATEAHRTQIEADAHFAEAVLLEMQGDIPRAVAAFRRALEAAPDDEELAREVARRFLRYRQPGQALEILRPYLTNSTSPDLPLFQAEALLQLDRTADALQALQEARRRGATPAALVPLLGPILQRADSLPAEARPMGFLLELLEAPDADADSLLVLAEAYARLATLSPEERSRAPQLLARVAGHVASLNPVTPEQQFGLAELYLRIGRATDAIAWYERARAALASNSPLRRLVLARLADLYLGSRQPEPARNVLRELSELDPMNVQVHFVLGNLALESGRAGEAVDAYRRALALDPKLEAAYYNLAQALLALRQPDQVLAAMETARETIGRTFLVEYLSGLACSQLQDFASARRHFSAAEVIASTTETNRLDAALYFQLGVTAERTGDIPAAVRAFEQCLKLDPRFHPAQNYLGYMWAERGENLDRARQLIEQAVQADPNNSAYLDSMAWVLFRLGQPDQALPWMEKALQTMEDPDPTLFDHYGDILAALGRMEEARRAWQRALELDPDNAVIREKLQPSRAAAAPAVPEP